MKLKISEDEMNKRWEKIKSRINRLSENAYCPADAASILPAEK